MLIQGCSLCMLACMLMRESSFVMLMRGWMIWSAWMLMRDCPTCCWTVGSWELRIRLLLECAICWPAVEVRISCCSCTMAMEDLWLTYCWPITLLGNICDCTTCVWT